MATLTREDDVATRSKPKRRLTAQQKRNADKSAKDHGRSKPGLWENVNASKGKGPKAGGRKSTKGETRPGKGSRKCKCRRR